MAASIHIPTNSAQRFPFLHILPDIFQTTATVLGLGECEMLRMPFQSDVLAATTEAHAPRARALQQEKPPQ